MEAEVVRTDYLTELSVLYEISSIPTSLILPDELGRLVLDKATRLLGAPVVLLYRWEGDDRAPRFWAARGVQVAEVEALSPQREAIARALDEGQAVTLEGIDTVRALGVLPANYPARQGLCLSIRARASVRALLCAFRLTNSPFTRTELALFGVLADKAGTALENIRLFTEAERRYRELQREVAERKRAEETLARQAEELARSNAELRQFTYVASHHLQEPLRMVTSYTQLLAKHYQGKLDADADEFIRYAVDGAKRMRTLIHDLLAYFQVDARAKDFAPADCEAILERVLSNLRVAIEESDVVVTHEPLPTVMANATQLTQVFQHLIDNGLKFRGDLLPEIHIGAECNDGEWLFSVRDNGIGIERQYLERIFTIFQQLHIGEKYPGTGIGLAICKKIVERHGGRIWVESELGQGSTSYFTIPDRGSIISHEHSLE